MGATHAVSDFGARRGSLRARPDPADNSDVEIWVAVDRRPGPDGRERSTPVAAFSDRRRGVAFMAASDHPMLLVPVPLVEGSTSPPPVEP